MKLSCESLFVFHAIALKTIVLHGSVREVDALNHKPNVLHADPSSSRATLWASNHNKHMPISRTASQQHTARQREQSKKSMEMAMTHENTGIQRLERKSLASPSFRSFVIASMLAIVAVWKSKAVVALLQYPGWFLSNILYKPYQNSLVKNPLITKVITGAVLAVAGDAVAQSTSTDQTKIGYDKRRALSFAVFDSCYRFFQHNMFPIVIRLGQGNVVKALLPKILPSKTIAHFLAPAAAAIEQTAMYQFVIVPLLYYPIFFAFTGSIQGLSTSQSLNRMKRQFFPCWTRNLMFWIPTQMILFGVVAEKWQIPFACLMGVLWSMILSTVAGNSKKR